MPRPLSPEELVELQVTFADLFDSITGDVHAPINPLTYLSPDGDTCLHIASLRGNRRAVELLLDAGLDIDCQGDMGHTALHYAATQDVIDVLLKRGASTTTMNLFGEAPIGWRRGT